MGLYNNWVVPTAVADDGVYYFTQDDLQLDGNDKFPHESADIQTFDPQNNRIETVPTADLFIDTTQTPTYAVIGDSPVINTEGTFYLLEIQGLNLAQVILLIVMKPCLTYQLSLVNSIMLMILSQGLVTQVSHMFIEAHHKSYLVLESES